MRILVAVASKHGSTREIAEAITKELCAQKLDAVVLDASAVRTLEGYQAVVLGSAIYAGNWLPEAKEFAQRYQAELSKLPVWVFSSGPIGAVDPKPQDNPARLAAPLGKVKTRDHRIFVGRLDPDSLSFAERLIVKAFRSPTGDFRNWEEIREFARGVATALLAENVES